MKCGGVTRRNYLVQCWHLLPSSVPEDNFVAWELYKTVCISNGRWLTSPTRAEFVKGIN
jgi:hypothetical protein